MPDSERSRPVAAEDPVGLVCLRSDTERAAWVTLVGELDAATVPELDRALRRAEADAGLVVLDLRPLSVMDASGAHLLVAADRRIRQGGGGLAVVRGSAEVERFLELVGADRELELVGEPPARTRFARGPEAAFDRAYERSAI